MSESNERVERVTERSRPTTTHLDPLDRVQQDIVLHLLAAHQLHGLLVLILIFLALGSRVAL